MILYLLELILLSINIADFVVENASRELKRARENSPNWAGTAASEAACTRSTRVRTANAPKWRDGTIVVEIL